MKASIEPSNPGAEKADAPPIEKLLDPPSMLSRYTCASVLVGIFAIFAKFTFVGESQAPGAGQAMHNYQVPLTLTVGYVVSLPLFRVFTEKYLSKVVDAKLLLTESMIVYNAGQVILNAWMVYQFIYALLFRGHPLVGDIHTVNSGATYAVWVHYCDKYLEFFDTYFMVLRGKMDQVSFLHVYHHATIAWAWWAGMTLWPGGDAYFGALLNSWIHVMMYSYYALSLLKIRCPWKKYLTMAQLVQFTTVFVYSGCSICWLPEDGNWRHYLALAIQDAEMISLFMLFLHFYKKAYSKQKASRKELPSGESDTASDSVAEQLSVSSISTQDADESPTST